MKATILYHPQSDHARKVMDFAHDLESQQGTKVELVSLDTIEGSSAANLYDITQYPAVIVTRDEGSVVQVWSGEQLPLMNEVAAYAHG